MAEFEEVKVKLESNDDDLNDPFLSGRKVPDSQWSYYDAESFLEQLPDMHAVKEEFGFSPIAQNQIKSGSLEGLGLPIGVDRHAKGNGVAFGCGD
jgi:hypothetical protein